MLPEEELEKLSRNALLKEAQEQRNSPTFAEKRLWKRLRGKRMFGLCFRHHYVYKNYIFNF